MNRKTKRTICIVATVALVAVVALNSLQLVKTGNRPAAYRLPPSLARQVVHDTRGMNSEQIVDYAVDLTTSKLRFGLSNDIDGGVANCVGYASLCAAICNRAFESAGLADRARPVVGDVRLWSMSVCQGVSALPFGRRWQAFTRDHDFVEWNHLGKVTYFDPSMKDLTLTRCQTTTG